MRIGGVPRTCAGFKAGSGNAHQLRNRSDAMVVYLEIGDRTAGDLVTYPDDDIQFDKTPEGRLQIVRKDGSPYGGHRNPAGVALLAWARQTAAPNIE